MRPLFSSHKNQRSKVKRCLQRSCRMPTTDYRASPHISCSCYSKDDIQTRLLLQVGHGWGVAGAGALPRGGGEHCGERAGRAHPPPPSRRPGTPSHRTDTHLGKRGQIEYIHVGSSVADP
jgi:hypothetical protein